MRRIMAGLAALMFVAAGQSGWTCTVAVVSGEATPDGRPLLWKNRDSGHEANRLVYFEGERFAFLGVVNAEDVNGDEVWAGVNGAGFCIMNSASYNLYPDAEGEDSGEARRKDEEGILMKDALGRCATVADFEKLLAETSGDRGVEANFGVIDAQGGASFFETTNEGFVRFDATDKRVAPEGYIVRTNYSFTGAANEGYGYIRFDRISELFHQAVASGGISAEWLLTTASRDMVNGLTDIDPLAGELPAHARDARFVYASDSLVRDTACSTSVFHGAKDGEAPSTTTMWVRLGHPLCSVAVPQWVAAGPALPLTGGEGTPPIDRFALYWHARVFPLEGGSRHRYLDLAPVLNRQGSGLLPRLMEIESDLLHTVSSRLGSGAPPEAAELTTLQRSAELQARQQLCDAFPQACAASGL